MDSTRRRLTVYRLTDKNNVTVRVTAHTVEDALDEYVRTFGPDTLPEAHIHQAQRANLVSGLMSDSIREEEGGGARLKSEAPRSLMVSTPARSLGMTVVRECSAYVEDDGSWVCTIHGHRTIDQCDRALGKQWEA